MELDDPDDFTQLSALIKGFSNDTRLALLLGFYHGYSANAIASFLDMTRGGLQNNITKMVNLDLVYRPSADEAPTYALTPLGEFFARIFDRYGTNLLNTLTMLRETESEVRQQLQDSPMADSLSDADERKLIHTQKWQEADHHIRELLDLPEESSSNERPSERGQLRSFAFDSNLSSAEIEEVLEEVKEEKEE